MFSGKTTALIQTLAGYPAGQVRTFKHVVDCRYAPDAVVSHDGRSMSATAVARGTDISAAIPSGVLVMGIDEGHFFDESLVEAVGDAVLGGVDVVLAALDLDCQGRPFPIVERLHRAADRVLTLTALCVVCGTRADRTQRLVPLSGDGFVGGAESYEPRCFRCWRLPPGLRG
jgi:thymidine kinase